MRNSSNASNSSSGLPMAVLNSLNNMVSWNHYSLSAFSITSQASVQNDSPLRELRSIKINSFFCTNERDKLHTCKRLLLLLLILVHGNFIVCVLLLLMMKCNKVFFEFSHIISSVRGVRECKWNSQNKTETFLFFENELVVRWNLWHVNV
jgi:hypothetical protein